MLSEISLYNWDIDNKNNFMTCLLIYKGIIKKFLYILGISSLTHLFIHLFIPSFIP